MIIRTTAEGLEKILEDLREYGPVFPYIPEVKVAPLPSGYGFFVTLSRSQAKTLRFAMERMSIKDRYPEVSL